MKNPKKEMFDYALYKILEEDVGTDSSRSQWQAGIQMDQKNVQPQALNIIKSMYDNKVKEGIVAGELPFPLENLIPQLGDLYVKVEDTKRTVFDGQNNPVVRGNEQNMKTLATILSKLRDVSKMIEEIGGDLDNFTVESDES